MTLIKITLIGTVGIVAGGVLRHKHKKGTRLCGIFKNVSYQVYVIINCFNTYNYCVALNVIIFVCQFIFTQTTNSISMLSRLGDD